MTRYADFDDPPVVETVLSVSYAPLDRFASAYVGEFRQLVMDDLPEVHEQPIYEMPIERLSDPYVSQVEFRIGPPPARTRTWLISEDGERLIQVQSDWFGYNWRKRSSEYVHYEDGRERFSKYFRALEQFVETNELGQVKPSQCEVTYVNRIPSPTGRHSDLADVLSIVNPYSPPNSETNLESSELRIAIALTSGGAGFGRLHVSAEPGFDNGIAVWLLNLTARGNPLGSGLEGVLAFFDKGRQAIVENFVALTTSDMHKRWRMKE